MTQSDPPKKIPLVADIMALMEDIAPPIFAETWDNCGLQVGSRLWPVGKIWVALDPQPAVLHAAAEQQVDMVISHHPLLFHPLRHIDVDTPTGKILQIALTARIALYAAHTNLDRVENGLNDVLARQIGLTALASLETPKSAADHPLNIGIGRIGRIARPMPLQQLAMQIKSTLNLPVVKFSGDPRLTISVVALCCGAGGGLLEDFLKSDAQVFISGDLRYHDARTVENAARGMIDVGHFGSELIMIDAVTKRLRDGAAAAGWSLSVEPCRLERDPFRYLC